MKLSKIAGAVLSLGLLLNALPSSAALTTQRLWTLNMKDAELRDLTSEVGEITGKTLVVDARLQGKVSVQSSKALDQEGIYSLFLSVLRSQGFVALDQGDRVLIMPAVEAKTKSSEQSGDEFVTRVLDLRNANAAEISGVVRPLVSDDAYVAPSASSNALVVSDSASNVERIRQVVSELDQAGNRSFSTVALKHAWASDVARTLNESISQTGNGPSDAKAVGDARSNRVILAGNAQARQRMAELVRDIDVPSNANDSARVVRLHHSDAKQLSKLLNGIGKRLDDGNRGGGEGKGGGNSILVSADESQNALVLMADPAQLSMLDKVITQLDQPRAQVLVEAAIVEVSGDINEALGVQWAARAGNVAGGTNFSGTGLSIGTLLGNGKDKNITLPDGAIIGIGTSNFGALVTALSSDSKNNLLSTPSLLTLDNEAAEILVGQNVPFQTGSYTTDTAGASNPFTTVERQDVGVTLKVTPHINEGNTLRLKVEQESSELASAPPGITTSDVITNKRSVKSTILADDGQIIVLGGLIKDNVKTQVSKVPVLGSIPLLGRLFTSTKDVTEKTNLMVFLRPTLVRGSADAINVSQRKYNDLRKLRANGDSRSGLALPADSRQLFDAAPQDGTIDMRAREPRR
ncbi:General secretion pathway protein D [Pseudomonas chlororaphis subsp. aureofaciens]|uniref:General secretion pathway protein D n=1 Tax=Pseudomonas chlororaphis subsp. aureofaciens TaxID=587851 RepID=A0AAD0ZN06_9PSED|nr:type II secretion system secretin GspD [Pseudomonas chlororaphis]AZE25756.1 General secretion pathway protein D [Pseudomonas chlororaphis subsp. aureofaciens]AZE32037.1 General secretion pathway protein D [Pseudomonas chlororaphis subsp. aureofaciens]AZE38293.1 General secretion pathway protein D [Pseudomonas chlororaphis subsp. aureofaciens]AZE44668.1 General secretion pathway protein D [Pseudomonas chlororaphis subsp. aureofaciens]QHC91795.1 type II secretion system protein GspD [Pseudomo